MTFLTVMAIYDIAARGHALSHSYALAFVRSWFFLALFAGAGAERRTYICLVPGRLLVGDTTPTDQFSGEGSAARRLLLRWCDVLEEFIGAPVSDVEHPATNALDEFLYGFDAEVASDYVI
ncbi:hypothetical protein EVAR_30949_1 [Eumeta japonica]|uniref:Uncharacterized protein n=1 Tax=Eumeta variegata TaxID=151549 RepID=A0A4C1V458_EUMVA|nr:hypothetical protein EVAR_30949_1 [Eumeta japonica]